MATISQLLRESNPPPGQPRSPLPQIYDRVTQGPAVVEGYHGAPGAVLLGPNGQPISANNRLPVDVGGQIHADVDLGDVTVEIAEVQQGKRGANAEPWEVTLSGSTAEIGQVGAIQRRVVLFDAVEIRDTNAHTHNLIQHAGMTEDEVRRYREFRISFLHSHDAEARVRIYTPVRAFNSLGSVAGGLLFDVADFIPSGGASRLIVASAGGQNASQNLAVVPALRGIHSNIIVTITYATMPTSGSLTVHVEMQS